MKRNDLVVLVEEMRKEAQGYRDQNNHQRAGGLERASTMLESLLAREIRYVDGEQAYTGDTVMCGGEQFRVDRIDYQNGVLKSYIDPTGYAASSCVLISRG